MIRTHRALAAAFLLVAAGGASFGQTVDRGPQVRTFFSDVDDTVIAPAT